MTNNRLNEIIEIIHKQDENLLKLKTMLELTLAVGFLDNRKEVIHSHLCSIDSQIDFIHYENGEVLLYLNELLRLKNG